MVQPKAISLYNHLPAPGKKLQRRYIRAAMAGACLGIVLTAGAFFVRMMSSQPNPQTPTLVQDDTPNKEETSQSDDFIYGVTVDRINDINETVAALQYLPKRPTTRIVFDEYIKPATYIEAVDKIGLVSDVMGEVLDSFYVKEYSLAQYKYRTEQYVSTFADKVAIWEIGNEVNGEWLLNEGEPRSVVVEKVTAAYDVVEEHTGQTALTLYYNEDCWEEPEHEMFRWVQNDLPARIKQGVDYVLVSYYEDDCNGLQPDWQQVFERLRQEFPTAKLGFGEVGTENTSKKTDYLHRYYTTRPDVDGFIGGYFWWYFWEDMVEPFKRGDTRLLDTLTEVMR